MLRINSYETEFSAEEIGAGKHREHVGGLWDEIGLLQFQFLKEQGLRKSHRLVDVGCGPLRGGLHFVEYLNPGNYYGLDINASLIEAARHELKLSGLENRGANLLVDSNFALDKFAAEFDFAVAQSVFTHLPFNHIITCLVQVRKVLKRDGRLFATFFQAPVSAHIDAIEQLPVLQTYFDKDPYHYSFEEMQFCAREADIKIDLFGNWNHPRNQQMLVFSK
jgi:ubiquinone/menaquinone biosynthesis C-methylase UbiE